MLTDIVAAEALPGHRLRIRFEDGVAGDIDVGALVGFAGAFARLRDEAVFAGVRVDPELDRVVWPCGADLAPDTLHALLTGRPVSTGGAA